MPTPSGRETAQEKRDRQHRERWAKINAAVDALPAGWAQSEAEGLLLEQATMRAAGEPSYRRAAREYPTEPEAVAVSRIVKEMTGAPYVGVQMVIRVASGFPVTYQVEAR